MGTMGTTGTGPTLPPALTAALAAFAAALLARPAAAGDMHDPLHCEERGAKELVRPMEPFLCTRAGSLNGVRLKDECENALRNIVDGPGAMQPPSRVQSLNVNSFCRPGRDVNIVKSEFTCYCTDRRQWDCHKGATPEKPIPGRARAAARTMKVPRKCDNDIVIHKMYTDFCDMYGMYVTYDDCVTPRNHTITVQNWMQRDTPVVCLPGSYTIYMRCQLCRCVGGVYQQDCDFVDCPWASMGPANAAAAAAR